MTITEKTIDLESVIAGKNPSLLRIMPNTLIRYLKRIVHENDLNEGLYRLRDAKGLDFIDGAMEVLSAKVDVDAEEHFPDDGRIIAVSNHPLGGLDGIALIRLLGRRYGDVRVPVNDLLMNLPNLRELFVPINKHGSNRSNYRLIEEAFASDATILHFPAGLCSRKRGGRISDLEWHKSFIVRARRYRRNVLPIHFSGRNSNFFYGLANLRGRLGIKANIEMAYLVDEMFKQQGKSLSATIGKPIGYQVFDKRLSDYDWAKLVRRHVYRLADDPEAVFTYSNGEGSRDE